jgi:PAS domain S-box-containing protein
VTDTANERPVLVVEDDEATAELERRVLERAGFRPQLTGTAAEALALLERQRFDAVLLDYRLPDGEPWSVVEAANLHTPRIPVILVTAMGNERVAAEAIHRGIADYIRKADSFWEELPRLVERVTRLTSTEEQLRQEQARLAEAQRIARIGSWEWDVRTNRVTWSDELYRIYGRERHGFGASYESFLECVHPEDREDVRSVIVRSLETGEPFTMVNRAIVNGQLRFVEGRGTVTRGPDGEPLRMAGTAQDVTERELQQAKLRESDAFFELSLELLCTASVDGYFRRLNPAFKILGWSEQELLSAPFINFVHPDDVPSTLAETEKLRRGIRTIHFENRYRCKDGSYRWIAWASTPDPAGILYGTGRDITEQKRAQQERESLNEQLRGLNANLRSTLKEREVLLQEIHHRVKNNLQVISSLINMQIRKLEAGDNRDALEECRTRVQAIALIHEKLYQSHDYARIPFAEYAQSLAVSVFETANVSPAQVELALEMDDIELGVDQAIPCGLVLNELITNALKHGFKDGRSGKLRIALSRQPGAQAQLCVANDGIELPEGFESTSPRSLGMQLVTTLAAQLNGELEIDRRSGTCFLLTFPLAK